MTIELHHVIDGEHCDAADGRRFDSVNPATQEVWATVPRGSTADADRAVRSARRAFDEGPWPRMSPDERATVLHRLADLMVADGPELARLDTTDMGKPISQAIAKDVPRSAHNFRFFADYAKLAEDESFPVSSPHLMYTRYDPVGVTAAISPWNFPLMLATWKVAPALAFGNTVVLKPAEQTPASCTRLAELALQAGLPPGVLNVVHGFGPGEAGEGLTTHPEVDLVTFTGESNTGRAIMAAAAPTLKRVSFEMGGKGANVVFADCDLERSVDWSIQAIFTNAGQVCLAGSRLYVERPIFDEFVARFVERAEAMRLGDPLDAATEVGPLASEEHWRKVSSYLEVAEQEGAKMLTGGLAEGWWIRPTVFVDVHQDMRVCREEIFGPVVVIQPFDGEEEGIRLANDTPYGLNAMVFTENVRRAHRVAGAAAGRHGLGQLFLRPRPARAVRWVQGIGHRTRRWQALAGVLHRGEDGRRRALTAPGRTRSANRNVVLYGDRGSGARSNRGDRGDRRGGRTTGTSRVRHHDDVRPCRRAPCRRLRRVPLRDRRTIAVRGDVPDRGGLRRVLRACTTPIVARPDRHGGCIHGRRSRRPRSRRRRRHGTGPCATPPTDVSRSSLTRANTRGTDDADRSADRDASRHGARRSPTWPIGSARTRRRRATRRRRSTCRPTRTSTTGPTWDPDHEIFDAVAHRVGDGRLVRVQGPAPVLLRHLHHGPGPHAGDGRGRLRLRREAWTRRHLRRRRPSAGPSTCCVPLRHVAWGANMNNSSICAYGYGTALTAPCIFQAMDQLGIAQYLTRIGLLLGRPEALDDAQGRMARRAAVAGPAPLRGGHVRR